MESLERFQQSRRVIEDFTSRSLAAIPNDYARLFYISSLRDPLTGHYRHDGLETVYGTESVQLALSHCHEELFGRILEIPLEQQEWDLRISLAGLDGGIGEALERWKDQPDYAELLPEKLPNYLLDLFASNFRLLLGILSEHVFTWRTAA
ncbi:MAG: hypothetical protein ACLP1Y_08635 [Candidatus Acidiferrales bacterium]